MGAPLAEVLQDGLGQVAADRLAPVGRIDAQDLDPAGRLLEAELAGAHLAQHEPRHPAVDLGHHGGFGVPP